MTSTTLNTGLALPSSFSSPSSPRSPRSVRGVPQQDCAYIHSTVSSWKSGEIHIDETVSKLLPEALKHRAYAREVYVRLIEEVRAVPDKPTLVGSRKALYAAGIFSKYAGCVEEFDGIEASFILSERAFKKSNPEIYGEKF